MPKTLFIPQKLRPWIEARRRFHLSQAQVQMARELGMNPKKLGKLNNHKQERWKLPLPQFIEECYWKRFHKEQPDDVRPLEAKVAEKAAKQAAQKVARERGQGRTFDTLSGESVKCVIVRSCPLDVPRFRMCGTDPRLSRPGRNGVRSAYFHDFAGSSTFVMGNQP